MLHFRHVRRALRLTFTALGLAAAWTPSAPAAEAPTPQAIDANAEFLASPSLPAPPVPGKVCVVDTGVDLTTDLGGAAAVERYSVWGGSVDDVGGSGIPKHGTYVAGIIASKLDGQGSVGIWPQARIVSVRVFPDAQSGTSVFAYVEALDVCRDRGATVVNLSLSGLTTATLDEITELENRIVDLRLNWNISVVAAAGNTGAEIGYPGKFRDAVTVGASDRTGRHCDFSARGPELDLSALGCGVLVSLDAGRAGVGSGTSFATPVVAGALTALRSYQPQLTAQQAEHILLSSARRAEAGNVIDVAAAFRTAGLGRLIAASAPPLSYPTATPTPTRGAEHLRPTDGLAELGVRKPRLRRVRYRNGVLDIVVSGVPDYGRAIFFVDKRRYVRRKGRLRIRVNRAPHFLAVAIDVPAVGRTKKLRIRIRSTVA